MRHQFWILAGILSIGTACLVAVSHVSSSVSGGHAASPAQAASSSESVGTVDSLVGGLRARLEAEPGDAAGWLLLARSYDHLGRNDDAIAAYMHARELGKEDPAFETSLLGAALADAREGQQQ